VESLAHCRRVGCSAISSVAGYDNKPLLIGKFGEEYDRVNMAWMGARQNPQREAGIFQAASKLSLDTLAADLTQRAGAT